jgi:hypothetical protein
MDGAHEVRVLRMRGMLTCPGCSRLRKRDVAAAVNIGRLWLINALGLPRPRAFDPRVHRRRRNP